MYVPNKPKLLWHIPNCVCACSVLSLSLSPLFLSLPPPSSLFPFFILFSLDYSFCLELSVRTLSDFFFQFLICAVVFPAFEFMCVVCLLPWLCAGLLSLSSYLVKFSFLEKLALIPAVPANHGLSIPLYVCRNASGGVWSIVQSVSVFIHELLAVPSTDGKPWQQGSACSVNL